MNFLLELLEGGDLRSDGHADEVADEVINNLELFELLYEGLNDSDDIIRGRTAHALEKVSRTHPELFLDYFDQILSQTFDDPIPMVRWHLAMLLINLDLTPSQKKKVIRSLKSLLNDESIFVVSWAISGLTILAIENPSFKDEIVIHLKKLKSSQSAAVRNRVSKALKTLEEGEPITPGWVKRSMKTLYD
jgi:HEAT repeat protein